MQHRHMLLCSGYVPMALAVSAPRQVLSRHFHNPYEQRQYILWQQQQRMQYWKNTTFLSIVQKSLKNESCATAATKSIVDQLSRGEVIALTLAMGVGSSFPEPIPRLTASVLSAPYCRRQIRYLLRSMAEDDLCIHQEIQASGSSNSDPLDTRTAVYLQTWTDMELLDACYLRGLALRDLSINASTTALEHQPSRSNLIEQLQRHILFYISHQSPLQHENSLEDHMSPIDGEGKSLRLWLRNISRQQEGKEQ